MREEIIRRLQEIPGKVGFYYKNLVTGEEIRFQDEEEFEAASVIKIPILIEAYKRIHEKKLNPEQRYIIKKEDKLPSCGALTYMHDGLEVTLRDLYTLMIILSDNSATNCLIKLFGMESINQTMEELCIHKTRVNRLLFDSELAAKGIQNYITPDEIGKLLEQMYHGTLISEKASAEMLDILKNQRLNGKIPFYITDGTKVAHKTGEDDGITHDVGLVYTKQPFVICFCSNEVEVPAFERLIQDISREFIEKNS